MKNNLFGPDPIMSISYSNDEIIKDIMTLHNIDRFDLDCTYSRGVFWKNLPQPLYKSDLKPQSIDVIPASCNALPFSNLGSIMFDPPFIIAGETYHDNNNGSSIIAKRFEGFKDFKELKDLYYSTLKETYRILNNKGLLVFKCQDIVSSGKNHFSHSLVMNMAIDVGYYPKDLFILMAKNRINAFNGEKWKKQYHARKHHSYFWVLQKIKNRVDYSF